MHGANHITASELEVMKLLWKTDEPVSSVAIRSTLQQTKGWEKSTILTLIRRLQDKQIITAEKRDVFYYRPNVTEAAYTASQMQEVADQLYQGSVKHLVAALCHGGTLSEADLEELKAVFQVDDDDA